MSNKKIWILTLLLVACVVLLLYFSNIFIMFFGALLVAYMLNPLIKVFETRLRVKRGVAVLMIALLTLAFLAVLIGVVIPPLAVQLTEFMSVLPEYIDEFQESVSSFLSQYEDNALIVNILNAFNGFMAQSDKFIMDLFLMLGSNMLSQSSQLVYSLLSIVLLIYFMLDGPKMRASSIRMFNGVVREKYEKTLKVIDSVLWKYLKTQVIISAITAIVCYIGFIFFNMPYSFLIAAVTFVLNFIPIIGPLIASAIAILITVVTGGWLAGVYMTIFVLVINQLIANILSPRLQGKSIGVHPVLVIFSLLVCSQAMGFWGMFIAVPVAGLMKFAYTEIHDYLKDLK